MNIIFFSLLFLKSVSCARSNVRVHEISDAPSVQPIDFNKHISIQNKQTNERTKSLKKVGKEGNLEFSRGTKLQIISLKLRH